MNISLAIICLALQPVPVPKGGKITGRALMLSFEMYLIELKDPLSKQDVELWAKRQRVKLEMPFDDGGPAKGDSDWFRPMMIGAKRGGAIFFEDNSERIRAIEVTIDQPVRTHRVPFGTPDSPPISSVIPTFGKVLDSVESAGTRTTLIKFTKPVDLGVISAWISTAHLATMYPNGGPHARPPSSARNAMLPTYSDSWGWAELYFSGDDKSITYAVLGYPSKSTDLRVGLAQHRSQLRQPPSLARFWPTFVCLDRREFAHRQVIKGKLTPSTNRNTSK